MNKRQAHLKLPARDESNSSVWPEIQHVCSSLPICLWSISSLAFLLVLWLKIGLKYCQIFALKPEETDFFWPLPGRGNTCNTDILSPYKGKLINIQQKQRVTGIHLESSDEYKSNVVCLYAHLDNHCLSNGFMYVRSYRVALFASHRIQRASSTHFVSMYNGCSCVYVWPMYGRADRWVGRQSSWLTEAQIT